MPPLASPQRAGLIGNVEPFLLRWEVTEASEALSGGEAVQAVGPEMTNVAQRKQQPQAEPFILA